MSVPKTSKAAELERLAAVRDVDIDLSDIPELTDRSGAEVSTVVPQAVAGKRNAR